MALFYSSCDVFLAPLKDNINGYLFDKGDQKDLIESALRLVTDDLKLAEMGLCSRRLAEEKFSLQDRLSYIVR